MESAAGLIKLKPGFGADLKEWRETLLARQDEVLQTLRDEGVALESWFQIEIGGEHYLLWFMHAKSIEKAFETFMSSKHEIDVYHLETMSKMADSQIEAVSLLDLKSAL